MRESEPAGRAAVAAIVFWIVVLTAVFVLLEAPVSWLQIASRFAPGIWEARSAVHGVVYRDYAY